MTLKFFAIPALNPEPASADLLQFLNTHRVVAVDRHLVQDGGASFWAICVNHLARASTPAVKRIHAEKRAKVDYREVLSEPDFAVYTKLRDLRRTMAQREGVPPYALFTNDQLAAFVTGRLCSAAALKSVTGVGPTKAEKYGPSFAEVVARAFGQPAEVDDGEA